MVPHAKLKLFRIQTREHETGRGFRTEQQRLRARVTTGLHCHTGARSAVSRLTNERGLNQYHTDYKYRS